MCKKMGEDNIQISLDQKKRTIRNHIKTLLDEIERKDSWVNAEGLTAQTEKIVKESKQVFLGLDISTYILPIDECILGSIRTRGGQQDAMQRIVQIRMALNALLNFYNDMMGDPISQELIDDSLNQAIEVLNDENKTHAILLASVFIRISIEQALKTLCNLNNIQYAHKTKAKVLNEKLCGNKVYPSYVMEEVQSKLDFLNAVIHNDASPPLNKIREALDWSNKFITGYLPAPTGLSKGFA
jgi:hypothetical protein